MKERTNIFLSIVTISFNQAEHLGNLLDSVCPQLADDIELIVVDPGSTDGSREILENRRDYITHLILEPDDGPSDGLNRGFSFARGHIGYYINSDDLMMPNAVNELRRLWGHHHNADILLGGAWRIDGDGAPLREMWSNRNTGLGDFLNARAVLIQQGMSFKMEVFRAVGGFNVMNRSCWDYELLCRMLSSGARAVSVPERFGAFRMWGRNISSGVGGEAVDRRWRDDNARIYLELSGTPRPRGITHRTTMRVAKLFFNIPQNFQYFLDKVAPTRMMKRWSNDFSSFHRE